MMSQTEYDALYAEHCRICEQFGPDAPESDESLRKLRLAARERRNHYIASGEARFGRI